MPMTRVISGVVAPKDKTKSNPLARPKIRIFSKSMLRKVNLHLFFLNWEKLRSPARATFKILKSFSELGKPWKYTQKSQFWIYGWIGKNYVLSFTVENEPLIKATPISNTVNEVFCYLKFQEFFDEFGNICFVLPR